MSPEVIAAGCAAVAVVFVAGMAAGRAAEASYWRMKAEPGYRTAVCSGGKFYAVLPESEFVHEWQRKPRLPPTGGSGTAPPRSIDTQPPGGPMATPTAADSVLLALYRNLVGGTVTGAVLGPPDLVLQLEADGLVVVDPDTRLPLLTAAGIAAARRLAEPGIRTDPAPAWRA